MHPALLPLMRTPRLPAVDWTDTPADINGLVRFAERRNLVSARVPSHFKRSLHNLLYRLVCHTSSRTVGKHRDSAALSQLTKFCLVIPLFVTLQELFKWVIAFICSNSFFFSFSLFISFIPRVCVASGAHPVPQLLLYGVSLTHYSGRVTQICVLNTVKLGTSASSP